MRIKAAFITLIVIALMGLVIYALTLVRPVYVIGGLLSMALMLLVWGIYTSVCSILDDIS